VFLLAHRPHLPRARYELRQNLPYAKKDYEFELFEELPAQRLGNGDHV
jgi:hypothetical protein